MKGKLNGRQLINAVRTGSPESVAELFRRQNDPRHPDGRTLVHLAVDLGKTATVEALAAVGADLDAADREGFSPLHYAARDAKYDAFAVLVERGANPALPDGRGCTPLRMLNRPERFPHDAMSRFVFRHSVMAKSLVRMLVSDHLVPDDAVARMIDDELRSHELGRIPRSDVIFVVERPNARPFGVIVEFRSEDDFEMAEIIAFHRTHLPLCIRENYAEYVSADDLVPFVVTAAVYTGTEPWTAPENVADLMGPSGHPALDIYRPQMRYALHDVHRVDYSQYEGNPAAAYFRLYRGDRDDVRRAAEELDGLLSTDEHRPLRRLLMTTAALGSGRFPEAALEGDPSMAGFARHCDTGAVGVSAPDGGLEWAEAAVERGKTADAKTEESMISLRDLAINFVAEAFDADTAERLRILLDGIDDYDELLKAVAHVGVSNTPEKIFAFFERRP